MNIEDVAKQSALAGGAKNQNVKKAGYDDIEISDSRSSATEKTKKKKDGKTRTTTTRTQNDSQYKGSTHKDSKEATDATPAGVSAATNDKVPPKSNPTEEQAKKKSTMKEKEREREKSSDNPPPTNPLPAAPPSKSITRTKKTSKHGDTPSSVPAAATPDRQSCSTPLNHAPPEKPAKKGCPCTIL